MRLRASVGVRSKGEADQVIKTSEEIYGNKRKSYTKNQVVLGGVPIYVDEEYRDQIIPKATQKVEVFYDVLR